MKNLLLLIICLFPTLLYGVGEVGSVGGKADSAIASVMGVAGGSIGTLCGKTYNDGDACSYSYTGSGSISDSPDAYWWRSVIPASTTSCSGTQIRVTFEGHTSSASIISGTSICERSGTTDDCTATPTRITWGTGNNGVTLGTTGTTASDWITYTWDTSKDHLIHIYMADAGTQYFSSRAQTGITRYYDTSPATDVTMEQTVTSDGSTSDAGSRFLVKIEVQ